MLTSPVKVVTFLSDDTRTESAKTFNPCAAVVVDATKMLAARLENRIKDAVTFLERKFSLGGCEAKSLKSVSKADASDFRVSTEAFPSFSTR